MPERTAFIVGAGDFTPKGLHPGPGDALVAADKGFESLHASGLTPQMVIGDMDSISHTPAGIRLLRFPVRKDLTDLALAVKYLRARGYGRFLLYGATGGRPDHTMANLQLLCGMAAENLKAAIVAPGMTAFCIADGTLVLPPVPKFTPVSVFSMNGGAEGVTLRGLKYLLNNSRLDALTPLGVSNEATGQPMYVSVKKGVLMVMVMSRPER